MEEETLVLFSLKTLNIFKKKTLITFIPLKAPQYNVTVTGQEVCIQPSAQCECVTQFPEK